VTLACRAEGPGCRAGGGSGAGGQAYGQAPGAKAASGGLIVMVMVQPGWSFWSCRSSQACFC
jgi:hypothetical protein